MEESYSVYQDPDTWIRDITLLCCVLRLRCQPAVPYNEIADIVLRLWPCPADRLVQKVGPVDRWVTPLGSGMRPWLAEYLQLSFEHAEQFNTGLWAETQDWAMDMVREVLRITKLGQKGYIVMEDAEVGLQIKWRREGNWKAGSTPLAMPRRNHALEAAQAIVLRNSEKNRALSGAVRPGH